MHVDEVLMYIHDAASSELYRIAHALKNRPLPCLLLLLPDEVLLHIFSFMRASERLAFARALHRYTLLIDDILIEETAMLSIHKIIQRIGEGDLYALPSCLQMKTYFLCNWSAFSSSCPSCIGQAYWTSKAPHARVDARGYSMKRAVRHMLKKRCAVLRISSFLQVQHASPFSVTVKLNGRVTHILKDPIQTFEVELLPPRLVLMLQKGYSPPTT